MPGPTPKDPSTLARRNKKTTAAALKADAAIVTPELPFADWHDLALEWWRDLWSSPLSVEYLSMDRHALMRCMMHVNDYWQATTPKERNEASVRIEAAEKALGLNPMARRGLGWKVEKTEDANPVRRTHAKQSNAKTDPRLALVQ